MLTTCNNAIIKLEHTNLYTVSYMLNILILVNRLIKSINLSLLIKCLSY